MIEPSESGTPVSFGLLPLQKWVNISTIFPRLEENNVSYGTEAQETKAVTGRRITLKTNKRMGMACLVSITTEIKRQGLVGAGLSLKAAQALLPTVAKDKNVLNTAVLTAYEELSENTMTVFATLPDAMKSVCPVYDSDFELLTESHEIKK